MKDGYYTTLEKVPEEELWKLRLRFPGLGDGELEVIWWGLKHGNGLCVLDDRKANRSAKNIGLRVTGTIGILRILSDKVGAISDNERQKLFGIG